MTGDRARRGGMWALATLVAAIAAIVSYNHIFDLARANGGTVTASRLLPLSVDALILVGELMLLHEADEKGRRFRPGWLLVWSGILATLAANVTYGAQFGALGAILWGWPAYSFILVAWGMVAIVKRGPVTSDYKLSSPLFTDAESAALAQLQRTYEAGNPLTKNALAAKYRLSRPEATRVYELVIPASNGSGPPAPE